MADREWHPPWLLDRFFRLAPWGFPRQILMILADGDRTFSEIVEGFSRFMLHFGHFGREEVVAGFTEQTFTAAVLETLEGLEREGIIVGHGAEPASIERRVYGLTPAGRQRALKYRREYQELGRWIEGLLNPQTVSLIGLGVHIALAALKLVAGAISGSIGMISDGMDTAMDGLSSVLVFAGLRLKKEQIVNVVLVLLMLGVGIGAGNEAVRRVFVPEPVEASLLTFAAAIVSGLVCLLLSLYQRYVATRSGQQPLIAQAVDSRNHAIVAAGVITGLVATLLHFPLLDTLVGLVVAALILKSGIELAVETVRALRGEQVDFSRYELGFVEDYRHFQQRQLADWLLSMIADEGPMSQQALLARCSRSLDAQDVPILRELGWGRHRAQEKRVANALKTLIERGWVADGDMLQLTEKGRAELSAEGWRLEEMEFYTQAMGPRTRYVHAPLARRIASSLPSLPEAPLIVDIGCGPGYLSVELARLLPGATFLGVDPSPYAVDAFQQVTSEERQRRFEVRQGRSDELPVDSATVDLIVSRESLHEWQDKRAGCAEMCRVLKPGGFVALEDLNRTSPGWQQTLFVLVTGIGTGLEITRERVRAYQDALTLKDIEGLLEESGFAVLQRKGGLSWYVVARKKEGAPRGL